MLRHSVLATLRIASQGAPTEFSADGDKLLLLAIQSTADGFRLTAREFDHYLQRWGRPIQCESRQSDMLAEQLFALAELAVAPLARFELDPKNEKQVILYARGSGLLATGAGEPWAKRLEEIHLQARHGDEAREGLAAFLEKREPNWM